jgi:hypothetical protein
MLSQSNGMMREMLASKEQCMITGWKKHQHVKDEGAHEKTKPLAVMEDCINKINVDKSDQKVAYKSFQRKSVKCWKKFFHLCDLVFVNGYIL